MGSFGSIMHVTEVHRVESKPRAYSSPTCFSANQVSHTPEFDHMSSKPPPLPPRPNHVPHHVPIPLSKSIHCMGIQGMETENTIHVQSPRTILSILQENTI